MNQLGRIQQNFQDRILFPQDTDSPAWISPTGRARPETQLGAYSYAYRARLTEVLASDYPAVHMAIGDDAFAELTAAYIRNYPSQYFSLRDFSRHMPQFMQLHRPVTDQQWLYELASFEWALCEAFDAADAPILTEIFLTGYATEDWPQLRFAVHPSLHRLDFNWNIPEMWQVLTSDTPSEITALEGQPSAWLVWRDDLITRFRSLQQDELRAFDCLCAGDNFADICTALATQFAVEEVPYRAVTLLKTWLAQGLISGAEM